MLATRVWILLGLRFALGHLHSPCQSKHYHVPPGVDVSVWLAATETERLACEHRWVRLVLDSSANRVPEEGSNVKAEVPTRMSRAKNSSHRQQGHSAGERAQQPARATRGRREHDVRTAPSWSALCVAVLLALSRVRAKRSRRQPAVVIVEPEQRLDAWAQEVDRLEHALAQAQEALMSATNEVVFDFYRSTASFDVSSQLGWWPRTLHLASKDDVIGKLLPVFEHLVSSAGAGSKTLLVTDSCGTPHRLTPDGWEEPLWHERDDVATAFQLRCPNVTWMPLDGVGLCTWGDYLHQTVEDKLGTLGDVQILIVFFMGNDLWRHSRSPRAEFETSWAQLQRIAGPHVRVHLASGLEYTRYQT